MDNKQRKKDNPLYAAALIGGLGVQFAAFIVIGYFAGSYLSQQTGSEGWIVGGVLTGLIVGIVSAVMIVLKVMEGSDG